MRACPQGRQARVVATKKKPPARVWGEGDKGKVRGRAKAGLAQLTITACSGGGESVAEKEVGREMNGGQGEN